MPAGLCFLGRHQQWENATSFHPRQLLQLPSVPCHLLAARTPCQKLTCAWPRSLLAPPCAHSPMLLLILCASLRSLTQLPRAQLQRGRIEPAPAPSRGPFPFSAPLFSCVINFLHHRFHAALFSCSGLDAFSCIFLNAFSRILCIFMHCCLYAFSCIVISCIFVHFHAFSRIAFMHFRGFLCIFMDFDSFSCIFMHFHAFLSVCIVVFAQFSTRGCFSCNFFPRIVPFGAFFSCVAVGFLRRRPRSKELWQEEAGCGLLGCVRN